MLGGKEHWLFLYRLFAFVLITLEECLNLYSHGGPWYDIRFITCWGLWMTWLCFGAGLFALDPPPVGDRALLKSLKYSPWRAWKWHTLLFELALTFEINITIVYWTLLFKSTYSPH